MKSTQLLSKLQFREAGPNADPIYVDQYGRAILFALKPGQTIKGHEVPHSPFYALILKGHGLFAGADGKEQRFGPNDLVIFDPGEEHLVRALGEELAFIGFLHGAPSNTTEKIGGEIGHSK
jgi:quercetin dioxygenase-like cupin family protein